MSTDYKKEWMDKSSVDYFPIFISLWLACNSWYKFHYSEISDSDRNVINEIKKDYSGRNHLYENFINLIETDDRNGTQFRTNVELLHYYLDRANLQPERISACSFQQAVTDYNNKENLENLIENPRKNTDGSVHANDDPNVIKLDKIYITSDTEKFFAGLFEIIYQVRNMLIHGNLNPENDEHKVIKYCYLILWDLMN